MSSPSPTDPVAVQEWMKSLGFRRDLDDSFWTRTYGIKHLDIFDDEADFFYNVVQQQMVAAQIETYKKVQVSLRAFVNGTSTFPAADELLEIRDRIAELQAASKVLEGKSNG